MMTCWNVCICPKCKYGSIADYELGLTQIMIDEITQNFHMLENECLERFCPPNIVFVDSIVALAATFTSFVIKL